MPELPEVETTCRGIAPHLEKHTIKNIIIRNHSLRWPILNGLPDILAKQTIHKVSRRAKYLLFQCDTGTLIIHLGMSGHLQIVTPSDEVAKHSHVDITLDNDTLLRYTDPRRFGAVLWTSEPIEQHHLLKHLAPEPLSDAFTADYLTVLLKGKKTSIKNFIMNSKYVVGVGNIYANEALFLAGIHPKTLANDVDHDKTIQLVAIIKQVLTKAIKAGGTTLKDFKKSDGKPGYFAQQLNVYGRESLPCPQCNVEIKHYKEAQRATFYCPHCQAID